MARKIIGLSLSFCIGEIIRGKRNVNDVVAIVTATKCATLEDFEYVIERYCKSYFDWKSAPELAKTTALHFWHSGMIEQPRLSQDDGIGPNMCEEDEREFGSRWWVYADEFEEKMHYVLPERQQI